MNNMLLTPPCILNTLENKKKMLMPYHNHFQKYYSMAKEIKKINDTRKKS